MDKPIEITMQEFLRIVEEDLKLQCSDRKRKLTSWYISLEDVASRGFNRNYNIEYQVNNKDSP